LLGKLCRDFTRFNIPNPESTTETDTRTQYSTATDDKELNHVHEIITRPDNTEKSRSEPQQLYAIKRDRHVLLITDMHITELFLFSRFSEIEQIYIIY